MTPADYTTLGEALLRTGFAQSAAEYHGALAGALCVQGARYVNPLTLVERDDPADDTAALQSLHDLRDQLAAELADSSGIVNLLLPDDDTPLAQRTVALGEWCEGFLLGLASRAGLNLKIASPELREIVADLTQFTAIEFSDGDDLESEEAAYAELVEYVRVGLQLIFVELSPGSAPLH